MANNPRTASNRRATIEAMRRQQQRKERRKTLLFVGIAVVIGLLLIAVPVVPLVTKSLNDPSRKSAASFGVPAAAAACDPVVVEESAGSGDHVDDGVRVDYAANPPASGRHDGTYLTEPRAFYEAADRPSVEKLVHSLEHGHTILWYDATVTGDALEAVRGLAERMRAEPHNQGKFIAAPWTTEDASRGTLPPGKHVVLTHWGATRSVRQYCGAVSGEATQAFTQQHPASDAPEPNAP